MIIPTSFCFSQEIFTDASSHLHPATNYYAYFDNVTILIPRTWSDKLKEADATTERFDIANIVVDQPHPHYGDNPYTKQILKCGQPGEYVHLTERWVKDERYSWYYWGDPGKVIVHEWSHLRWGVYDEYPIEDNEHFYYDENGRVQPTRCSASVVGESLDLYNDFIPCNTDPESGVMPSPGCRFFPYMRKNVGSGSYMYAQYVESILTFCHSDDDKNIEEKHNRLALNKHNTHCRYESTWDVLLRHTDFTENNGTDVNINVMPSFLVVKEGDLRIVLILDVSGSMSTQNRFMLMIQASTKYIGYTVPNGTWIGIVEFSTNATILSYLEQVGDLESRQEIISDLPTTVVEDTCIGCGLEAGIEVLEYGGKDPAGGIFLLLTDGRENVAPYISDVIDELVEKEIVVDTIAFSSQADPGLAELSAETGGTAYWYSESDESTALHDAFTDTITSRTSSSTDTPVQLTSYKTTIAADESITEYVYIDSTIGRHTIFFIFWDPDRNKNVEVVISSPDGSTIDEETGQYFKDKDIHTIMIIINGIAQSGQWTYTITNVDSKDQTVEVSIESKSIDSSSYPLRLQSTIGNEIITESPPLVIIYAEVLRGYGQVLDANVVATVERPSPYESIELRLLDNGVGADITKDDGTYSAYFLDFVNAMCIDDCRYSIQINADDEDGTASTRTVVNTGALPINYDAIPMKSDPVPIGDFERVTSGGSIQVDDSVHIPGEDEDPYPPSRISDLESPSSDYDEQTITLHWTAVGDDLDQGTADFYELRYSTSFSVVFDTFEEATEVTDDDLVTGNLDAPLQSGSLETFTVVLPTKGNGTTYYFAVRAVDDADNKGEISTVAQNTIVPIPSSGLAWWEIFLIVLAIVLAVSVVVFIVLYAYFEKQKKQKVGLEEANYA
uniref:Epithelial chloride channel protein-like n=1 Tax=Saccoglossus kowalevskii TaxID=10224 RepID=A0ABM0LTW1_SACKO|nr:PREDICTED: epithelial chloride channel protein-like [Saccoglossus kowalevskii]